MSRSTSSRRPGSIGPADFSLLHHRTVPDIWPARAA
jgi:hypothetical protein